LEDAQEALDMEPEEESEVNIDGDPELSSEDAQEALDMEPEEESEEITDEESIGEEISDEFDDQSFNKSVVEGALFVAGRPISIEEIHIKSDLGKGEIKDLVEELAMDYLMRPTCLEIVQIQDKYSLQIKPEYTPKLKKFATGGLIPDSILKTLTIIALKQPIMKSILVKLRGSTAYEHVKYLNENGYVILVKKGRSSEISTSDQFADTFGLSRDKTELKKQMITQLGIKETKD
jgi:segregation and condensation protein B